MTVGDMQERYPFVRMLLTAAQWMGFAKLMGHWRGTGWSLWHRLVCMLDGAWDTGTHRGWHHYFKVHYIWRNAQGLRNRRGTGWGLWHCRVVVPGCLVHEMVGHSSLQQCGAPPQANIRWIKKVHGTYYQLMETYFDQVPTQVDCIKAVAPANKCFSFDAQYCRCILYYCTRCLLNN